MGFEEVHEFAGFAVEDLFYIVDIIGILLMRDETFAAAETFFKVVVEAEASLAGIDKIRGDVEAARAQGVELVDESEYSASRASKGVGAVVFRAVFDAMMSEENAREKFLGDAYPGVRFIVLEEYIVARFVLLDHGVFEVKGILFGRDNDI